MTKETFKWAVLGPGGIAHKFAQALAGVPGASLYAVGSRDLGRAQAFAAAYGAPKAYGSYEELVADSDVDAFYISTPHIHHCENAIACLKRGKPVLVEKPMSINAQLERRMVEASRQNNAFLMEAMWSRHLPAAKRVCELLAAGAIGEPRMLTANFSFSAPLDPQSRLFSAALAGGGFLDVGIYLMALSSMVFGPHPVHTAAFSHIGSTGVDEYGALLLQYPGDKISSLTCGVHAYGSGAACIIGTQGRIELTPFYCAQSIRIVRDSGVEELELPFLVNGFEYEIAEAMQCIRQGLTESPIMPLDESIAIMETLDEARRQSGLVFPPEVE
jgi:dihydrodiol dehydrogenase / D-xylose 1-dehydrogenase (NADP)